ncbi:MAG: hypothetical protein WDN46_06845 [Methylocella sp.]
MPNNTVPAADTGLPNLNRRSALAKLGMGIAGGASLAAVPASCREAAVSSDLRRLIEDHRVTKGAALEAEKAHGDATELIHASCPEHLPVTLSSFLDDIKMSEGVEACKKRISSQCKSHEVVAFSGVKDALSLKVQKQLTAAFRAAKKDTLRLVDEAFAKATEVRQSVDLEGLDRARALANEAEYNALMVVCAHRCATLTDADAKADYLADEDGWMETAHYEALRQAHRKEEA